MKYGSGWWEGCACAGAMRARVGEANAKPQSPRGDTRSTGRGTGEGEAECEDEFESGKVGKEARRNGEATHVQTSP